MNEPQVKITGRAITFSESLRRLNPHLFGVAGRMVADKREPRKIATLDKDAQRQPVNEVRLAVRIVSFSRRVKDDDNFAGGCKHLRDAIADSIGIDDGDKRIKFEYQQIESLGPEGTMVLVHAMI